MKEFIENVAIESIVISLFTSSVVTSVILLFFGYIKDKRLKRLDLAYKYVIPVTEDIFNKLIDMKIYFISKQFEYSGCEFVRSADQLNDCQNKSTLTHLTELRDLLEKKRLFLSKKVVKNIKIMIQGAFMLCSIEILDDENLLKNTRINYKLTVKLIDDIILLMQKSLNLYV